MQEANDGKIIQSVLTGNQAAYATLVNRYQHFVFTLTMRYVNNREVAEELSQDIFVKAFRFLPNFKGDSKFSTWLYTIVNTTCLSFLRNKKESALLPGDDKVIFFSDQGTINEQPVDALEQKSQKQMIEAALYNLPVEDREIITLFYMTGQSIEEIGKIMGLTVSNVKVKLFRGRRKLKEILLPSLKEYQ